MDIAEWVTTVRPNWKTRIPSQVYGMPDPILGPEDAGVEWSQAEKPVHIFTTIDTYEQIKSADGLFLFGRRGTGKTALIRMLDYEIKSKQVARYHSSWVCDSHPLILGISAQLRQTRVVELSHAELAAALEMVWVWFAYTSAMIATIERSPNTLAEPLELKQLRSYLEVILGADVDAWPRTNVREVLEKQLAQALRRLPLSPTAGDVKNALADVFDSQEHRRAISLLLPLLAKSPCLVVLDAGEVYAIRDALPAATITALIATVHSFANDRGGRGLFLKAAFPSEILPHMYAPNAGKMKGRIVLIHWTYRDLVVFIAKRYRLALFGDGQSKEFDRLQSFDEARSFLYKYLPSHITTRTGVQFDTLSYVVRHTQKTPRQVILLMNSVLTFAQRKKVGIDRVYDQPTIIVNGVHARLEHLVADAIDMHKEIYPDIELLIKRVLSQQDSYFRGSRLDALVKRVSDYRDVHDISRTLVKRILFEVGVLGLAYEAHSIGTDGKWLLEGLFEYQLKDTILPNEEAWCMVHPMFYEWLQSRVDQTTFSYPMAYEDEEKAVLESFGVRSVATD